MNRLNNYMRCHTLAKQHLITAEEKLKRGDLPYHAIMSLIQSVRETQAAMHNLSSMYFGMKPKVKKKKRGFHL